MKQEGYVPNPCQGRCEFHGRLYCKTIPGGTCEEYMAQFSGPSEKKRAARGKCAFCKKVVAVCKPDASGVRYPHSHKYRRGATYSAVCPGVSRSAEDIKDRT